MKNISDKCLNCGAPMKPPKRGDYSCDFCGAKYSNEGLLAKSIKFLKIITETKGYNSSIFISVGLGSILLTLLIFRYPYFQKKNAKEESALQTQNIIINQPIFEGRLFDESIEKSIKETIKKVLRKCLSH